MIHMSLSSSQEDQRLQEATTAVTHANMTAKARDSANKIQSGHQENISVNVLGSSENGPTSSSSGKHDSGNNGSYSEGKTKLEPEMRETLKNMKLIKQPSEALLEEQIQFIPRPRAVPGFDGTPSSSGADKYKEHVSAVTEIKQPSEAILEEQIQFIPRPIAVPGFDETHHLMLTSTKNMLVL